GDIGGCGGLVGILGSTVAVVFDGIVNGSDCSTSLLPTVAPKAGDAAGITGVVVVVPLPPLVAGTGTGRGAAEEEEEGIEERTGILSKVDITVKIPIGASHVS